MALPLSIAAAAGLLTGARSLRGEALRARTAARRTTDREAAAALHRAARGMESYAFLLTALGELLAPDQ